MSAAVGKKPREKSRPVIAGFPSRAPANFSSASTKIRRSGRHSFSAPMAGVSRTRSPSERRRRIRISAPFARPGSKDDDSLSFNARFVDQHDRNIVADGVDAPAGATLQALLVER